MLLALPGMWQILHFAASTATAKSSFCAPSTYFDLNCSKIGGMAKEVGTVSKTVRTAINATEILRSEVINDTPRIHWYKCRRKTGGGGVMSSTSCTILSDGEGFVKWLEGSRGSQKPRNLLEVRPDGDFEPQFLEETGENCHSGPVKQSLSGLSRRPGRR